MARFRELYFLQPLTCVTLQNPIQYILGLPLFTSKKKAYTNQKNVASNETTFFDCFFSLIRHIRTHLIFFYVFSHGLILVFQNPFYFLLSGNWRLDFFSFSFHKQVNLFSPFYLFFPSLSLSPFYSFTALYDKEEKAIVHPPINFMLIVSMIAAMAAMARMNMSGIPITGTHIYIENKPALTQTPIHQ